jgi:restriction system protein
MAMSRSRIASAEIAERRNEREQVAAEARRVERVRRKIRDEEATRKYFAERAADARRRSRQAAARMDELRTILDRGLRRTPRIDLAGLREQFHQPAPDLGSVGWRAIPPEWSRFEPAPPSVLGRVVRTARYDRQRAEARAAYEQAVAEYDKAEAERQRRFADARQRYASRLAQERLRVDEHNRSVDAFAAAWRRREPDAVGRYLAMVLEAVPLPRGFPRAVSAEETVVRFALPGPDVVPAGSEFRYDPGTDEQVEIPRPAEEIDALHRLVVAQVVLLCLRDLFAADPGLAAVTFHGCAAGEVVLSVHAQRAAFSRLLARGLPAEAALAELVADTPLRRAS